MANYNSSEDIIKDALFRSGEKDDGTSDFNAQAEVFLNKVYRSLINGGGELAPQLNEKWWWLRAEASIILQPVIETGTVSVTNNSNSITFSDAPSVSVQGRFLLIDGFKTPFVISSHVAAETGATLDTVFTGDTDSAAGYKVMKLDYDLASDVKEIIGPMNIYKDVAETNYRVLGMELTEMEWQFPVGRIQEGPPTRFAPVDQDTVRFNKYVDELTRVDYNYIKLPADLSNNSANIPLVPKEWRHILADWLTSYIMLEKSDDRATTVGSVAQSGLLAMAKRNREVWSQITSNYGRILPRQSDIDRFQEPLRTEGGFILG